MIGDAVRGIPLATRPVQHEAAVGMHRSAPQHRLFADADIGGLELHLRHDVAELHAEGLVEHDAECAAIAVFANERDRLGEVAVAERGHGNQQLIGQ